MSRRSERRRAAVTTSEKSLDPNDLPERLDNLSPEKRVLLALMLRRNRIDAFLRQLIPKRRDNDPPPLTFAQERLWFLDRWEPGNFAYNNSDAFRLAGRLNTAALEGSLNEIVRRHEVLRSTLALVGEQLIQMIAPTRFLQLSTTDLSQLPVAEREAKLHDLITKEARSPFDLTRDQLVRAGLLKLSDEEHVLLLTMHHIISDGWSFGIFIRELTVLYQAFTAGKPSPLAELPIQYADYAAWHRQWLSGQVLEQQLPYWREQLKGAQTVLELPTNRPRPPIRRFQGARLRMMLSQGVTRELTGLSQREGVTLFMTLLAAFQGLLARYTGQEDIVIGSPVAGRIHAETWELLGCFVNPLALRTDLSGNPTFRELLRRVKEVALGAYEHQQVPFEKVVEVLQPERSLSHTPLFQVMFAMQNAPRQALELAELRLCPIEIDSGIAKFDLTLDVVERGNELSCALEYNTDLFDASTITRMLGHFQVLLEGIIADPDQRLSDLPLLTAAERHQLLIEWNDTRVTYPAESCLHQLFEEQVKRTPGAVALVFEEERLTYRELNAKSNQLAHYLRARGIGPECHVGICVNRGIGMVVGLLGILKAGAAYVPLDR